MKKIGYVCCGLLVLCMLSQCSQGSGNSSYENNLRSGYSKYQNGESMSKDEYNAVKDFNNWREKQREKKYSDWDD